MSELLYCNDQYEATSRTQLGHKKDRGAYARDLVHQALDEALICHVGFAVDGQTFVMPTLHARSGETVYLHGSRSSRMVKALAGGAPCCLTATIVDGLVLAKAALHHSLNYRSVVVLGKAHEVTDPAEKQDALAALVEHACPGRASAVRAPNKAELAATAVLALPLQEVSAKVREGPPKDSTQDLALPVWAGEIPLTTAAADPIPYEGRGLGIPIPDHVTNWSRDHARI